MRAKASSKSQSIRQFGKYLTKRQSPRVAVSKNSNIKLKITQPIEVEIAVDNISLYGIGLRKDSLPEWPACGKILVGVIDIEGNTSPVKVKIVHIGEKIVGGMLTNPDELIRLHIIDLFVREISDFKIVAINPYIINRHMLDPDEVGVPWWYKDKDEEIFLLEHGGKITKFFLLLDNTYFEGFEFGALRYGKVEADLRHGKNDKFSLLKLEYPVPQKLIKQTIASLRKAEYLPTHHLSNIILYMQKNLK